MTNNAGIEQPTWRLSPVVIEEVIDNAVVSIDHPESVFIDSMHVVDNVTRYINRNTNYMEVLNSGDCEYLNAKLGRTIAQLEVFTDDGHNALRQRLSQSLSTLREAIVKHEQWATGNTFEEVTKEASDEIHSMYLSTIAAIKNMSLTLASAIHKAVGAEEGGGKWRGENATGEYSGTSSSTGSNITTKLTEVKEKAKDLAVDASQASWAAAKEAGEATKVRLDAALVEGRRMGEKAKSIVAEGTSETLAKGKEVWEETKERLTSAYIDAQATMGFPPTGTTTADSGTGGEGGVAGGTGSNNTSSTAATAATGTTGGHPVGGFRTVSNILSDAATVPAATGSDPSAFSTTASAANTQQQQQPQEQQQQRVAPPAPTNLHGPPAAPLKQVSAPAFEAKSSVLHQEPTHITMVASGDGGARGEVTKQHAA